MDIGCELTLVMPVYNTLSRVGSNGAPLIDRMLASIAQQDAGVPKLLVLDNQSADGSVDHLSRRAPSNLTVDVQVDTHQRPPEEAIAMLIDQVDTPYVGVVNDDDVLASTFVAELLGAAHRSKATLTYPNARWLGLDGQATGTLVPYRGRAYGNFRSGPDNLRKYLRVRNPVPMIFGLWKTTDAQRLFDVRRYDEHSHDLDNLILARTLARGHRVEFVDRHLFQYSVRQGHRSPPRVLETSDAADKTLDLLLSNWTHHVKFSQELLTSIFEPEQGDRAGHAQTMALVISEELRWRLDRGALWTLGLAPATREEFVQLTRLRSTIRGGTSRWSRSGSGRRTTSHSSNQGLARERDHWTALLDRLDRPVASEVVLARQTILHGVVTQIESMLGDWIS